MTFAQLSRVRIEYFEHGRGPETVVFIHGFQASARIWQAVQEALPADRYRSIAINNRGAGQSEAPPDEADFGVPIFAQDAYALVTGLGLRDFTLVGHSLGGATVAQFAVDHPGLLKGLVLLDPSDPDGRDLPAAEMDRVIDARMAARREQQARGATGDGIDATRPAVSAELMRLLSADIAAAPERRLRGSMRSMFAVRLGGRVKDLPMPVLLCGGDADALIPISQMLATWAKYPQGTGLHIWHGVGHSPNLEVPGALALLLQQFVETTIPARRASLVPA
jgi:branched-chain amino acid transport system permease protein